MFIQKCKAVSLPAAGRLIYESNSCHRSEQPVWVHLAETTAYYSRGSSRSSWRQFGWAKFLNANLRKAKAVCTSKAERSVRSPPPNHKLRTTSFIFDVEKNLCMNTMPWRRAEEWRTPCIHRTSQWLSHLPRTREVPRSNLTTEINCPEW
jgi:hypothetical protein